MKQEKHEDRFQRMNAAAERLLVAVLERGIEVLPTMHDDVSIIDVSSEEFCFACDMCFSLNFNLGVLKDLLDQKITPLQAERQLQAWKYATYADQARNGMGDATERVFARTVARATAELAYLDQNILTSFVNSEATRAALLELKQAGAYQFVYSPSHIEEIQKIQESPSRTAFLDAISQLTDNISLQPDTGDRISVFKEDPAYPLQRVASTPDATRAVENMKVLKEKDRALYLEKYNSESHRVSLGHSDDVFGPLSQEDFAELMSLSASNYFTKEEFKGLKAHSQILNAIYALHNALDLISYKREKTDRRRKSSAHDIEHLIYGAHCGVFVSEDAGLVARARQIYAFMGLDVKVNTLDEFLNTSRT